MTSELYILSALRHKVLWLKFSAWITASVFGEKEHRDIYHTLATIHKLHPELEIISADHFASSLPEINLVEANDVVEDYAVRHKICNMNIDLLNMQNNVSTAKRNNTALLTTGVLHTLVDKLQKELVVSSIEEQNLYITLDHLQESKRWPTGSPLFDEPLEGGLAAGELFLLAAAPKAGKTHWLTYLASHYHQMGHDVMDFKLEDIPTDVVKYYISAMGREKLEVSLGKTLLLLNCSKENTYLSTVYREVEKAIIEKSTKPPVIIVDYADLLATGEEAEQRRFQLTDLFVGLRRLANHFGAILLTATQGTAEMWKIKYPDLSNLTEAKIGKAGSSDVIVMWSQLQEERERGDGRLIFAGTRGRSSRQTVFPVKVRWDTFEVKY